MRCSLKFGLGAEAVPSALEYWASLGARQRAAVLWDVVEKDKAALLASVVEQAEYAGVAYDHKLRPVALAWARAWQDDACETHFSFSAWPQAGERLALGRMFLAELGKHYRRQCCLIPRPWIGAMAFAAALGFKKIRTVPDICFIERKNRWTAGIVMERHVRVRQTKTR